jgi:hypothetical protein
MPTAAMGRDRNIATTVNIHGIILPKSNCTATVQTMMEMMKAAVRVLQ